MGPAEGLIVAALWGTASAAVPKASSEGATTDGVKHPASHAFDGLLSTGWAEGDSGDGAGAWVELRFDKPTDVSSISIYPGWLGGPNRMLREFGRPKLLTVSYETASGPVVKQERLLDPGEEGPLRHDVVLAGSGVKAVRLTIDEAFSGGLNSDTFIAEVAVNLVAGDKPQAVLDVATWLGSEAGQKVADAHRQAAIGLFDQISAADFGDDASFDQLVAWASDGAPYLRERAMRVPLGFRVSAVQPDKTAIEALLKLKDSNAIPAIERASLRVTGSLADDLKRRARLFDAYQELLGGGNRNIVPWGQEGFAKGALRSLGEPLDLVVDGYGGLYVADTGNNRVQRFGADNGIVDQAWGAPEPGVAEAWFGKRRDGYASGSTPGTAKGEFTNPVDLALVPSKSGDEVLVLDALGRVTRIDFDGQVVSVYDVPSEVPISPGVGGEGHIVYGKGKIVVILGTQGTVLSLSDGAVLGKFELKNGVPTSAVMFKDGKLGLVIAGKLIQYSIDGFRFGDLLGDSLAGGYQDLAVAVDEKGKLWAVVDSGQITKFKKPGKVDFQVTIGDYSLQVPRIAAYQDLVFVTDRDRILHADALELAAAAERGEAPGANSGGLLELDE